MKGIINRLLSSVSAIATVSDFASRVPVTRGARPTKRKPWVPKEVRPASPHRARKRREARNAYLKQLRKEHEIGTDPLYANGHPNRRSASAVWRKGAKAWDRDNRRAVV